MVENDIGPQDRPCPRCNAQRSSLCCSDGKVHLDPLQPPPTLLRELWTADTTDAKTFGQHARKLNSALWPASQQVRDGGGLINRCLGMHA